MEVKDFIPQVTFALAPLEMEADLLYSFSSPKRSRWKEVINRIFPELEAIIASAKNKKDGLAKCHTFAEKVISENGTQIKQAKTEIETNWQKVGDDYIKTLAEVFETSWPESKNITAYVSIQPVFPRFLDDYSFCVGYRNIESAQEVIAHEILHFLWFKKWKEVFLESKRKDFESPHLVWRLSEVMDPIILQCHSGLKSLIKPVKWGYNSFKDIKIGDVTMTEYFVRVYGDCVRSGKSFEDTLKILWDEAQKNRGALEKF